MEQLVANIGFGLITGATFAVPALGLTLMYGVSRFLNFAYGQWITAAPLIVFSLAGSVPLLVAIMAAIITVAALGPALNSWVFRPLAQRQRLVLLVTSIGLSFVLQNVLQLIWGPDIRGIEIASSLREGRQLWWFRFTVLDLAILAISIITLSLIALMLARTDLGMMIRASAENRDLAMVTGIKVERIAAITWAVASALAALGGVLFGLRSAFGPSLGLILMLIVASAIILGGLGSPSGAVVGAFVIGISSDAMATFDWFSAALKPAVAFAILAAVLIVRPNGLFGRW
jgi:branched-subunit amino acid ABC-type transport system permease component